MMDSPAGAANNNADAGTQWEGEQGMTTGDSDNMTLGAAENNTMVKLLSKEVIKDRPLVMTAFLMTPIQPPPLPIQRAAISTTTRTTTNNSASLFFGIKVHGTNLDRSWPSAVTKDGPAILPWYQCLVCQTNLHLDGKNGHSPIHIVLDSQHFWNRRAHDKLFAIFLDTSIENDAINFIGFGIVKYVVSCPICKDHASGIDTLTLKELCIWFVHLHDIPPPKQSSFG